MVTDNLATPEPLKTAQINPIVEFIYLRWSVYKNVKCGKRKPEKVLVRKCMGEAWVDAWMNGFGDEWVLPVFPGLPVYFVLT